jgi:hypothetical protein
MTSAQNQNFSFIFLGQSVLKYQVPFDIFNIINHIYETKYSKLKPANKQLVGKIEKEHSLFYDGENSDKMTKHNHLPKDILMWFVQKFKHYLEWNEVKEFKMGLDSIWVNQMFEHEYNPVHVHQGSLFTGLSSVMILKLPKSYGVEPEIKERDFFIFPYDMRHCVYPFNGPGYRRTLAANMNVNYDPIRNRGVS